MKDGVMPLDNAAMASRETGLHRDANHKRDASPARYLRAEAPLPMPAQDFRRWTAKPVIGRPRGRWVPRASLFLGTLMLTLAFAWELYDVLAVATITPLQSLFLVLSTLAFGWVAFGSLSVAMGFLPLFAGEKADTLDVPPVTSLLKARTALLFPVYHEDPTRIAGVVSALIEDLALLKREKAFEVFILSDTRDDAAGRAEETVYAELAQRFAPFLPVYYRRRRMNTARKAGNIQDWVERFGADYAHFIILDGDSVMSGRTLVRLAAALEQTPRAGLIQTVPRLTGGTTLLQKLQQFAANVYGPAVASGLAFWHRDQGNYWGHNAIIRTVAFAEAAGLPSLSGRPPFGGHIQSHDFVEAVLLQRAGWGVHIVPALDGSYEGLPPTLVDLVVRDRRWAQGNLQHLSIVGAKGLTPMGRVHLVMGAFSYLVSAVWAASLAVGLILALQGQQLLPSYFEDSRTLFPIWPIVDPGAALRLFLATLAVVFLPKVLGFVLELKRVRAAREVGGSLRAFAGVAVETVFSMLLAPILMITQTVAVVQILLGVDSGWRAQQRDGQALSFRDVARFHWRHTVLGVSIAGLCWFSNPVLLVWMWPVVGGLAFSVPLSWLFARPAGRWASAILATPEDRTPPAILVHTERNTRFWTARHGATQGPLGETSAVLAGRPLAEGESFPAEGERGLVSI